MQSLLLALSLHNDSVTGISLQKSFSTTAFMSSIPTYDYYSVYRKCDDDWIGVREPRNASPGSLQVCLGLFGFVWV